MSQRDRKDAIPLKLLTRNLLQGLGFQKMCVARPKPNLSLPEQLSPPYHSHCYFHDGIQKTLGYIIETPTPATHAKPVRRG